MSVITDFQSLKTEIIGYLKRSDLSDETLSGFVQLCTARLNRELNARKREADATIDVTTGEGPLPDDLGKITSFRFDVYPRPAEYRAPQAFHDSYINQEWPNAQPMIYTMEADLIKVAPAPDKTANAIITYKQKLANLENPTDTNIVLQENPDAYLYGSLLAASPYIGNDPRTITWATLYQDAVNAINEETREERFPHGGIRQTMSVNPSRSGRARVAQPSS